MARTQIIRRKGTNWSCVSHYIGIAWRHILPFPLLALRPRDPTNQSRMSFLDLNKAAGVVVLSDHTCSC
jgi:hypothetical protein